jgi:hypothetical protein
MRTGGEKNELRKLTWVPVLVLDRLHTMGYPWRLQYGDEPPNTGQGVCESERAEYPWGNDVAILSGDETEVEQLFAIKDAF